MRWSTYRDHGFTVNRVTAFRAKSLLVPYTPAEIQKHVHFEQNKQMSLFTKIKRTFHYCMKQCDSFDRPVYKEDLIPLVSAMCILSGKDATHSCQFKVD